MKKMRVYLLCTGLLLNAIYGVAQRKELNDLCQIFKLENGNDTTTFVVYGSQQDLKVKKPIFLFRQGSQPMPLIHQYHDGFYMPVSPFRFSAYKDQYHFVMISKPGVRLVADSSFVANYQEAMRRGDASENYMSKTYVANNYREKYVEQCNEVINFLVRQSWVNSEKVVFCGGSEGFTVGADLIANKNKNITHAILYSGNLGRRFENVIDQLRQEAIKGIKTDEQVQLEVAQMYELWEDICKNPNSLEKTFGDTYKAWFSFSIRNLDNLLKIEIPLYIAYGTADGMISNHMDMLPIEFELAGKQNLTFKSYLNYDHQFFEVLRNEKGVISEKIYKGDMVAADWMK